MSTSFNETSVNDRNLGGIEQARMEARQKYRDAVSKGEVSSDNLWNIIVNDGFNATLQLLLEAIDADRATKGKLVEEQIAAASRKLVLKGQSFAKEKMRQIVELSFYGVTQEWERLKGQRSLVQLGSLILEAVSSLFKCVLALVQTAVRVLAMPFDYLYERATLWAKSGGWGKFLVGNAAKFLIGVPLNVLNRTANVIGYTANLGDAVLKLAGSSLRIAKLVESIMPWTKTGTGQDAFMEAGSDLFQNGLGRIIKNTIRIAPEAAVIAAYTVPVLLPIAIAPSIQTGLSTATTAATGSAVMNYGYQAALVAGAAWLMPAYDVVANGLVNYALHRTFQVTNNGNPELGAVERYRALDKTVDGATEASPDNARKAAQVAAEKECFDVTRYDVPKPGVFRMKGAMPKGYVQKRVKLNKWYEKSRYRYALEPDPKKPPPKGGAAMFHARDARGKLQPIYGLPRSDVGYYTAPPEGAAPRPVPGQPRFFPAFKPYQQGDPSVAAGNSYIAQKNNYYQEDSAIEPPPTLAEIDAEDLAKLEADDRRVEALPVRMMGS